MINAPILRRYFGISSAASRMLDALYEAAGEPITRHDLKDFAGPSDAIVSDALVELRAAMGAQSLQVMPGSQVRITRGWNGGV
jgi:hypothetical protein